MSNSTRKQMQRVEAEAVKEAIKPPRVMDFENSDGIQVNVDGLLVTAFEAVGDLVCLHFGAQCIMVKAKIEAIESWLDRLKMKG